MTRKRKVILSVILTPLLLVAALAAYVAYNVFIGRPVPAAASGTVKVACVGDSVTYGLLFEDQRYPKHLQDLLGPGYSVRNFGAPFFTVQKSADHPYWSHRYFQLSSEFAPDIVIIMLGSNDSKAKNWVGPERFSADYRELIEHYRELPSHPKLMLMTPPSVFLMGHDQLPAGFSADTVATVGEAVRRIGAELSIPVVDVHAVTAGHPEFYTGDGLHPNALGAVHIAQAAFETLPQVAVAPRLD